MSIMKKSVTTALVCCFLFALTCIAAQAGVVSIVNRTGVTVVGIYVEEDGSKGWGDNFLFAGEVLASGDDVGVKIPPYDFFDLRVEYANDDDREYRDIPGKTTQVILRANGTIKTR